MVVRITFHRMIITMQIRRLMVSLTINRPLKVSNYGTITIEWISMVEVDRTKKLKLKLRRETIRSLLNCRLRRLSVIVTDFSLKKCDKLLESCYVKCIQHNSFTRFTVPMLRQKAFNVP